MGETHKREIVIRRQISQNDLPDILRCNRRFWNGISASEPERGTATHHSGWRLHRADHGAPTGGVPERLVLQRMTDARDHVEEWRYRYSENRSHTDLADLTF